MDGHVDDFHQAGDLSDERWLHIRSKIDAMYKWEQLKRNEHTATLALTSPWLKIQCLEGASLSIKATTLRCLRKFKLIPSASPWLRRPCLTRRSLHVGTRLVLFNGYEVAVQTQPLACARCNLLLSELAGQPTMRVAQEIQELIKELRKSTTVLIFFRIPKVNHWTQMVIVGLGHQAHQNRPKGGSTGGLLIFLSNQD